MSRNEIKDFFNGISDCWNNTEGDFSIIKGLLEEASIYESASVLDVGCGKGVITPLLYGLTRRKVIAIDISDKMIEGALAKYGNNTKYEFICGDFLEYSFDTNFDFIVIYNAYPHFLDVDKLKNKVYEVLNVGGKFVIMHSLGREKLNKHHSGVLNISRILDKADVEAKSYNDHFDVIKTIDEENRYLIILEKSERFL